MIIGSKLLHFSSLTSTNEYAKSIINTAKEGTVIIADKQIAGKGRFDRHWYSPDSGLWFSIILKPKKTSLFSLVIGIALCDALETIGMEPHIRWPNDILIRTKKVAGILTEVENDTIIVGVGLNVNVRTFPNNLKNNATSLILESGKSFEKKKVLGLILEKIENRYNMLKDNKIQALLNDWRRFSITLSRKVTVEMPHCVVQGEAIDIDEEGALLLKTEGGSIQKIIAGDCRICYVTSDS